MAVAAMVALPASSLASTQFKTGTYTGRTGQNAKIKFLLRHLTGCTGKTASQVTYCLGETVQANVNLKCPDGTTSNSYLDIEGSLTANGVLKYTVSGGESELIKLKVTPTGKISGYVTIKQPEGDAAKPVCTSGKIAIHAKLT